MQSATTTLALSKDSKNATPNKVKTHLEATKSGSKYHPQASLEGIRKQEIVGTPPEARKKQILLTGTPTRVAKEPPRSRKRWSGQSRHQASDRVDDDAIKRRVQAIMKRPACSNSEKVKDWRSHVRDNDRASVQAIESLIQCARNLKSERMKQRRSKKSYKRAI